VAINLLGPIRLSGALLPLLRRQARSTIMTVSSGLAFLPLAMTPTYCATKAALHSYTLSLRLQLRGTNTEVIELIPPYVQTELMGPQQADDPRAMPLYDFITEVMEILRTQPNTVEVCVERVKALRFAAESGRFDAVFLGLNEAMPGPRSPRSPGVRAPMREGQSGGSPARFFLEKRAPSRPSPRNSVAPRR